MLWQVVEKRSSLFWIELIFFHIFSILLLNDLLSIIPLLTFTFLVNRNLRGLLFQTGLFRRSDRTLRPSSRGRCSRRRPPSASDLSLRSVCKRRMKRLRTDEKSSERRSRRSGWTRKALPVDEKMLKLFFGLLNFLNISFGVPSLATIISFSSM